MTTELVKLMDIPELEGIEKSKAKQIKATFEPMVQMLEKFEDDYNGIVEDSKKEVTKSVTQRAKRLRLDISKVRIETGKIKDREKQEYLRAANAIQGMHNIVVWAVKDKEDNLKEIENYFEVQEQKRLEALQREREEQLAPYVDDVHDRRLGEMDEDVWAAYYEKKKKDWEDEQEALRLAEEKRLEEERVAKLHSQRKEEVLTYYNFWTEEEKSLNFGELTDKKFNDFVKKWAKQKKEFDDEQEKVKKENERLEKERRDSEERAKQELKKKAARAEEMRPYIVFIRDYNKLLILSDAEYKSELDDIKKGAEEQWAHEKKEKEKAEVEIMRRERKEEEERQKRLELEAKLKAKEEAERKAKQEAKEKEQAELNKGDADKVKDLIVDLGLLKTKYTFKSANNNKMYKDVGILLDKIVGHINKLNNEKN